VALVRKRTIPIDRRGDVLAEIQTRNLLNISYKRCDLHLFAQFRYCSILFSLVTGKVQLEADMMNKTDAQGNYYYFKAQGL
jgi:hypothetical protein